MFRDYKFFRLLIKRGDIVRCGSIHSLEPHFYEVSSFDSRGWYSQPGSFLHSYEDILCIFRYDGGKLDLIWSPM